jgi:hypothetical protein
MVVKRVEKKKARKLWRLNTQILKEEEIIRDRKSLVQRKKDH